MYYSHEEAYLEELYDESFWERAEARRERERLSASSPHVGTAMFF